MKKKGAHRKPELLIVALCLALLPSCAGYSCGLPGGTTCMKVENVLKNPPARKGEGKKEEAIIPLKKDSLSSHAPIDLSLVHQKPVIVTIFPYQDRNGYIHGQADIALPPSLPKLKLNREAPGRSGRFQKKEPQTSSPPSRPLPSSEQD